MSWGVDRPVTVPNGALCNGDACSELAAPRGAAGRPELQRRRWSSQRLVVLQEEVVAGA